MNILEPTSGDDDDDDKGVIIAVVVVVVVLIIVIVVVLGVLYVKHNKKTLRSFRNGTVEPDKGAQSSVHA